MPTTKQYLNEIIDQKKALATNIAAKGIAASETELLNTLVPKVAQIETVNGEEVTLENFTDSGIVNLRNPKSTIQINYPVADKQINVQLGSKNVIPYPFAETTKTNNGITWTVNTDGTITASGTATADSFFKICTIDIPDGAGTEYFLSSTPSNGSITTYYTYIYSEIEKVRLGAEYGNGAVAMLMDNFKYTIYATIVKGYTANNIIFKPQLESGSAKTTFTKYISDFSTTTVTRYGATATENPQTYTPTSSGLVTGITSLSPITTLVTNNTGAVFTSVTGETYKEITPSTGKNAITKVYQPAVTNNIDSNITSENIKKDVDILGVTGDYICNYTYDKTTKELVLIL